MIFHIPHSSIFIPPAIRTNILLSGAELEKEIHAMTDHDTDKLFGVHSGPSDTVVTANVSRLVVDVERFADDELEPMARIGMGVIYTSTSDLSALRQKPMSGMRKALLDAYYYPHHRRLTEAVLPGSLILDCHSFPDAPLPYETDQSTDRPDFCVGTDDYHTPPELAANVVALLESQGYTVRVNTPFSGSIVPARYYQRDASVTSIMLEVNRRLYMDRAENFSRTQAVIGEIIAGIRA
jgi:N-formylglutamate deformylase